MKLTRRFLIALVAVVLVAVFSVTALAATFTAATSQDLEDAFAYDGEDSEVVIVLQNDITLLNDLTSKLGKTYIINGTEYVLKDVSLLGDGTVEINADVANENNGEALSAAGNVTATVNGDVTAANGEGVYTDENADITVNGNVTADVDAVDAHGDSTVNVNGNVTGGSDGIYADGNASVTVTGNVTGVENDGVDVQDNASATVTGDVSAGNNGIEADDHVSATVTGNVTGYDDGIDADGGAAVTVNGNVTAETGDGISASGGIEIYDETTSSYVVDDSRVSVTVNGDVTGGDAYADTSSDSSYPASTSAGDGVYAYNADVTVNGNVTAGSGTLSDAALQDPGAYADGGTGVAAEGDATVSVSGNVAGGDAQGTYGYGGDGVGAYEEATVKVGGNVTGGDVTADPDVAPEDDRTARGGNGIVMDYSANVTVGGDVTGGNTAGVQGSTGGMGLAIIVLEPVNGDSSSSEGNSSSEPLPAGSVRVEGTAAGGEGEAAGGTALYYYCNRFEYEYEGNLQPEFDVDAFRAENPDADPTDFFGQAVESIYFLNYIGAISDEELADYDPNMLYIQLLANAAGISLPADFDISNTEDTDAFFREVDAVIETMTEEEAEAALWAALSDTAAQIQERYDGALADYLLNKCTVADVTVWELSDENGPMVGSSFGEEAAKVLCEEETDYIIRVEQSENGAVSVDKETAKEGETVTVSATPDKGYEVKQVLVSGTKLLPDANGVYSFTVPKGGAVTVSAVFSKIAEDPKDDPSSDPNVPNTGDNSPILYVVVLFGAAALSAALLLRRKNPARS